MKVGIFSIYGLTLFSVSIMQQNGVNNLFSVEKSVNIFSVKLYPFLQIGHNV